MKPLLSIDNLNVSYRNKEILKDINISVSQGEILAVVGESGSGKSTLLKSIQGLLSKDGRITNGSIKFKDRDITKISEEEMRKIRGKSLSMIFQNTESYLCPLRTIESQFIEYVKCHENAAVEDIRKRVYKIFEDINLNDPDRILKSYPFELSGGMNQRVAIALSIIENPDLILADEPTSALDVTAQAQVIKTLINLNKRLNTAIIIVTHNIKIASYMADNVAVMYHGDLVEYGNKNEVLTRPKHPYTKMLISSTPDFNRNHLYEVPEAAVSLEHDEGGCPFVIRCSKRMDKCKCEKPSFTEISNRKIACHLYDGIKKEEVI